MWMEAGQQHQQRVLRGYLRLLGTLDPNAESTKSNIPERASPLSLIGQTPASPASALSPAHLRRKLSNPVSTSLHFSSPPWPWSSNTAQRCKFCLTCPAHAFSPLYGIRSSDGSLQPRAGDAALSSARDKQPVASLAEIATKLVSCTLALRSCQQAQAPAKYSAVMK
jgi:hypothetical protein